MIATENRILLELTAGTIDVNRNGIDLMRAIRALIDQHWTDRGYKYNDGVQSLQVMIMLLARLVSRIPEPDRSNILAAIPQHLKDLVHFWPGEVGNIVNSEEEMMETRQ